MRVFHPAQGIWAFYDGRVEGLRFSDEANWVDPWALSLGICAYAMVDGADALVYDTHVSVGHAAEMRQALEAAGVRNFTVVLSHWHPDHVAGAAAFADCEVIASERTVEHLDRHRAAIEAGTLAGPPVIDPLVVPTRVFADDVLALRVGDRAVELRRANIHTDDASLLWLPDARVLLAADTMEDTCTFVDEPASIEVHLEELARVAALGAEAILPSHGDPAVIERGGYGPGLIAATEQYLGVLREYRDDPSLPRAGLREAIAPALAAGWVSYFPPYEAVHEENLAGLLA